MNRLLRGAALAAAGAAVVSLYRQWQRMPQRHRRHHLETWENEGGALPDPATAAKSAADAAGSGSHPRQFDA